MLSSTPAFFVFFVLVWLLFWSAARVPWLRFAILLAANLFFLAKFGLLYLLLPLAAATDYALGNALARPYPEPRRKLFLLASILTNVGLLVATKLVSVLTGDRFSWLLALSISFYCFQSLTYTVDLYRREDDAVPAPSLLAYLCGSLFFLTLVAGPILRLHDFFRQFLRPPALTPQLAGRALLLIGIGLVKKLLIADYLSENLVTRVFDTPTLYSGLEVLAAVYGYALQLFFDFSGYTDIALGCGLLLGLRLPENFNRPYLALNLMDFWRRWHISFSTWLRDYLQERLPQNRRKRPLASYCYSVIVTMLLGGLWHVSHGVVLTFLVWGALHGVALALVRVWKNLRKGKPTYGIPGKIVATLLTFHFVCFTWIFFNASSLANAGDILSRLASLTQAGGLAHDNLTPVILAVLLAAAVLQCLPLKLLDSSANLLGRMPFWVQGAALAGLVLTLQTLAGKGSATFIYGNF